MEHASKVWRYDHMSGRMLSGIPIELGLIQSVFIRDKCTTKKVSNVSNRVDPERSCNSTMKGTGQTIKHMVE